MIRAPRPPRPLPDLTRPEQSCAIRQAHIKRAAIYRANGCGVCVHRVEGWGAVACSSTGRTFPLCIRTGGVAFELDDVALARLTK